MEKNKRRIQIPKKRRLAFSYLTKRMKKWWRKSEKKETKKHEEKKKRTVKGARGYRKTLFGDEDGSANDARDEEGVTEEGSEVPRDRESAFG